MEKQTNYSEKMLENKGIQIIIKAFTDGKFDKYLGLFTKDNKLDKTFFDNFLIYLDENLAKGGIFLYDKKDFEQDTIDHKEWIENIKDILEMSDKKMENIDNKTKIKEQIEKYIVDKIDSIECFETKMELMKLFKD